jgi:hypothetical protein
MVSKIPAASHGCSKRLWTFLHWNFETEKIKESQENRSVAGKDSQDYRLDGTAGQRALEAFAEILYSFPEGRR